MTLPAFDRSLRSYDKDGRLHLEVVNLSKANVCPYMGREIPKWKELGLDPDRIYRLYRDPAELAAGAPTFRNIPLLIKHVAISAEKPSQELWVGTVGTDVRFEAPYLKGSLAVWTDEAIKLIETRAQEELSACYYYDADMTPGQIDGTVYEGVMRNIIGNHEAMVEEGRAGPDVAVPDESPPELRRMKFPRLTALIAQIFPAADPNKIDAQLLAMDAKADLADDAELTDAEKKDAEKAAKDAMVKDGKMSADAEMSDEDKKKAWDKAKDKKAKDAKAAKDGNDDFDSEKDKGKDGKTVTVDQMNAAIKVAADAASKTAIAQVEALYTARKAVEPVCGVVALDSADAVYEFALKQLKVEIAGVHPSAYPALLAMARSKAAPAPRVAMDAAGTEYGASVIWPSLARFRR